MFRWNVFTDNTNVADKTQIAIWAFLRNAQTDNMDLADNTDIANNMTTVTNWGNYPGIDAHIFSFSDESRLRSILLETDTAIARGLGRCYGDSSLSTNIISTLKFNRFLDFDISNGLLTCEAGVTFEDIVKYFVPRGWFLPVTPGTKFITVGGAIASDVHGKNHHKDGSFCWHVISMDVILGDGKVVSCSREENDELFYATCGGMGLTGIILRAVFRLRKIETAYIKQRIERAPNLRSLMDLFEKHKEVPYSVAWLDCLSTGPKMGRGVFIMGDYAGVSDLSGTRYADKPLRLTDKRKLNVPYFFPSFVLNRITVRFFNEFYYQFHPTTGKDKIVDIDTFFYPLDSIHNWNKIYGRRGFIQYQFVLPLAGSKEGLEEILFAITRQGTASFLSVLKLFGKQDSIISFPMEGYTLALDFPVRRGLFPFLDKLDKIVLSYGGRHYLTKDARMKKETLYTGYPALRKFTGLRDKHDNIRKFSSLQSLRLEI
jgi:decaprenylphospho-beta-D-ribofuranose 2-oxidase